MKRVLFIINLDKFTCGFYKFIISNFKYQDNWFLIYGSNHEFDFQSEDKQLFWCDSIFDLKKEHTVFQISRKCDLIVYSGLFGSEMCVIKFGLNTIKKTYLHLWGGDFYAFRNRDQYNFKCKISLYLRRYLINNSAGIITLIPNDFNELRKVSNPKGKHFVAPMCGDGSGVDVIKSLRRIEKSTTPIKIIVGNSATESNQHVQVFRMLEKFKSENIQIICPLSYGVEQYRDIVIESGKSIFGEKFVPLTEYMDEGKYYRVIAECHVAIFNNNRQQAMGNIGVSLALGCKVYIRNDTSMWNLYHAERKMKIFNVDDISHIDYSDFIYLDTNSNYNNYINYFDYQDINKKIIAWQNVFDSVE